MPDNGCPTEQAESKRLATARARLALAGFQLDPVRRGSALAFLVHQRGSAHELPDIESVEVFAARAPQPVRMPAGPDMASLSVEVLHG